MPTKYSQPMSPLKKVIGSVIVLGAAVAIAIPLAAKLPDMTEKGPFEKGESAFKTGRYEEAAARFEEAFQAEEKRADCCVYLARINGIEGDYQMGLHFCEAALAEKDQHPMALYYKALLLQLSGHSRRAVGVLEQLAEALPSRAAPYISGLGGFVDQGKLEPREVKRRIQILKGTAGSRQFNP